MSTSDVIDIGGLIIVSIIQLLSLGIVAMTFLSQIDFQKSTMKIEKARISIQRLAEIEKLIQQLAKSLYPTADDDKSKRDVVRNFALGIEDSIKSHIANQENINYLDYHTSVDRIKNILFKTKVSLEDTKGLLTRSDAYILYDNFISVKVYIENFLRHYNVVDETSSYFQEQSEESKTDIRKINKIFLDLKKSIEVQKDEIQILLLGMIKLKD